MRNQLPNAMSPVRFTPLLSALALLVPSARLAPAQSPPPGYADSAISLPASASNVRVLDRGRIAWFDGSTLFLQAGAAAPVPLLSIPQTFGAFAIDAGRDRILFAESGTGDVWLVPLSGAPRLLANLVLPYDAVMIGRDRALVSAKTGGFAAQDNDLVALDLSTGSWTAVGRVPGASGPLAVDGRGTVYHATASPSFPPPPGGSSILSWTRAAVASAVRGGPLLTPASARVLLGGIDTASSLAVDDDGDLLFVDWWNDSIEEVSDIDGPSPAAVRFADYSAASVSATALQFESRGPAVFEPFQPEGSRLYVHERDYAAVSRIRTVGPRRPTLTTSIGSPIPRGSFDLIASHGPPLGLFAIAIDAGQGGSERALRIPGFEQPFFWSRTAAIAMTGVLDPSGAARVPLSNPGFSRGPWSFGLRMAVMDPAMSSIGSSAALPIRLRR
ncbi:MAG: hypothetical protein Fur0037_10380 [Planctomycetota bacterium]